MNLAKDAAAGYEVVVSLRKRRPGESDRHRGPSANRSGARLVVAALPDFDTTLTAVLDSAHAPNDVHDSPRHGTGREG